MYHYVWAPIPPKLVTVTAVCTDMQDEYGGVKLVQGRELGAGVYIKIMAESMEQKGSTETPVNNRIEYHSGIYMCAYRRDGMRGSTTWWYNC